MIKRPYIGQLVKSPDGFVGKIVTIENDRRIMVEYTNQVAWDKSVLEVWTPPDLTEDTLFKFQEALFDAGLDKEGADRVINETLNRGLLIRERK